MKSVILCGPNGLGDSRTVVGRSSTSGSLPRFLLHVASPTGGRTLELRKTIRSGDSGPRNGSLSNATVRESNLSKSTNPIRGLADVPPLREISSKINSPAVYTRFSRKRKPESHTARTKRSDEIAPGLATGGVQSPQETRMDARSNAEDSKFPTKSIHAPRYISV